MKEIDLSLPSGAIFSDDLNLRFVLWRVWDNQKPIIGQVGLNPSTAGSIKNDATIVRSIVRSQKYGFGGLIQTNKYPHIATNPKNLDRLIGIEENDLYIRKMVELTEVQLCMWGSIINDIFRGQQVYKILKNPYCLGINPDGQPKHSLYIGYEIPMIKYGYEGIVTKRKYVASACPNCKETLNVVREETYEIYTFSKDTGTYQENEQRNELEVKCLNCGFNVSDLFPEGACNYQA